ncbi:hypothetical protein PMIT1342_00470 [Prochlorococcus marinus str. MIT 1342]|nr:hypothetical protein PMIT1342_00470 [Prochlorococcus marinus str. MIT 1342]
MHDEGLVRFTILMIGRLIFAICLKGQEDLGKDLLTILLGDRCLSKLTE